MTKAMNDKAEESRQKTGRRQRQGNDNGMIRKSLSELDIVDVQNLLRRGSLGWIGGQELLHQFLARRAGEGAGSSSGCGIQKTLSALVRLEDRLNQRNHLA